jgi:hypothetical protein
VAPDLIILSVTGPVVLIGAGLLIARVAKASRPDDPLWRMGVADEAHHWLRRQPPEQR